MSKVIFFLAVFSIFKYILCSYPNISPDFYASENSPMISRNAGIATVEKNSYINAVLAAAYSIPSVQDAIYDEALKRIRAYSGNSADLLSESVDVAVACKFAMMRLRSRPFPLDEPFYQALNKQFKLDLKGNHVNVSSFFNNLIIMRSEKTLELFKVELDNKIAEYSNHENVLKQGHASFHGIPVRLGSTPFSLAAYVKNQFRSPFESSLLKTIHTKDRDVVVTLKRTLGNTPDIALFHIERMINDLEKNTIKFNNGAIFIEREITLNNTSYILLANIEYHEVNGTYTTTALDFGDSSYYRYEADGQVNLIQQPPNIDHKSIILIYVPKSIGSQISKRDYKTCANIPQSLITLACNASADLDSKLGIYATESSSTKQTSTIFKNPVPQSLAVPQVAALVQDPYMDAMVKLSLIYKPNYNAYDSSYQSIFMHAENFINSKISIWPIEVLNILAKLEYRTFELGSEEFSFKMGKYGYSYKEWEILLTSFATNPKIVAKLIEVNSRPLPPAVESQTTIIVIQMLLGCKNISLEPLMEILATKSGIPVAHLAPRIMDASQFHQRMKTIVDLVDSEIICHPLLNVVTYSGIDSDDPVKVSPKRSVPIIKPSTLIPLRSATIKGVWFDTVGDYGKSRLRNIYSSGSEIFTQGIERNSARKNEFYFNSENWQCSGIVKFDNATRAFSAYFKDSAHSMFRIYAPDGKESMKVPINAESEFFYSTGIQNEAIQLFFTKKTVEPVQKQTSDIIPRHLSVEIMKKVGYDVNFSVVAT